MLKKFKKIAQLNRIFRYNENNYDDIKNENDEFSIFTKSKKTKEIDNNEFSQENIDDFILIFAFISIYIKQHNKRLFFFYVLILLILRTAKFIIFE
jgi:hypothetical protein